MPGSATRAITRYPAFKASPYNVAEHYAFTGGKGARCLCGHPPRGARSDSLTVTTIEMYRQRARFALVRPTGISRR
jgi:hypothetical protein